MRSPSAYRAPSWSWAALDGPVSMFRHDWLLPHLFKEVVQYKTVTVMEVDEARCVFDPPNSCSLVQTGWIIATAPLKRAYINPSWKATQLHSSFQSEYHETFVGLRTVRGSEETPWFGVFDQSSQITGVEFVDDSLYLLHIATIIQYVRRGQVIEYATQRALVVEKVGNYNNFDCFRRLGVAWYPPSREERATVRIPSQDGNEGHIVNDWKSCRVCLI
jgi:hypothetical protein